MSRMIRLLQLASPALPIGGYSYSSGLETAIDTGRVRDADSAFAWIADAVSLVLARFDAPLLAAAVHAASDGDRMRLADLNRMALAARETAELRLESEQAGYSLGRWIAEVAGQQGGQAEGADEADEADEAEDRQARADDATVSGDDPGRVAAIVSLAAGVGRPLSAPVG